MTQNNLPAKQNTALAKQNTDLATIFKNTHEIQAFTELGKAHQEIILASKAKTFKEFNEKDKQNIGLHILQWMIMLQIKEIPESPQQNAGKEVLERNYWYLIPLLLVKAFPELTIHEFKAALSQGVSGVSNNKGRHFQSFGADYISLLINEYLAHTRDIKYDFKNKVSQMEWDAARRLTEEEQELLIWQGRLSVVDNYLKNGTVIDVNSGMYFFLKNHETYGHILKKHITEEGTAKAMEQARTQEKERLEDEKYKKPNAVKIRSLVKEQRLIAEGGDVITEKMLHSIARKIILEWVLKELDVPVLKTEIVKNIERLTKK